MLVIGKQRGGFGGKEEGVVEGKEREMEGGGKRTTYNDIYHENDTAKLVILYAN